MSRILLSLLSLLASRCAGTGNDHTCHAWFRCVSHESKSHFIREEEKGQERKRDNNKGYQPPQVLRFTCSVTLATVFMGSVSMLCGWNGIKESYNA